MMPTHGTATRRRHAAAHVRVKALAYQQEIVQTTEAGRLRRVQGLLWMIAWCERMLHDETRGFAGDHQATARSVQHRLERDAASRTPEAVPITDAELDEAVEAEGPYGAGTPAFG